MWVRLQRLAVALAVVVGGLVLGTASPAAANDPPPQSVVIQKVDTSGVLVPGGKYLGYSCTRWDNDIEFQCQSLDDYAWFNNTDEPPPGDPPVTWGLSRTGSTESSFMQDIPTRGGWNLPIQQCLIVREMVAPTGFELASAPAMVCKGPGGWTVENAGFEITPVPGGVTYKGGLGDWTLKNEPSTLTTTLTLVNRSPSLTFKKVDESGKLLPGASIVGWSCSQFDGDPDWTCITLNDYGWFRDGLRDTGLADRYMADIVTEGGWSLPVIMCVVLYEKTPPTGYLSRTAPALLCKGPGGWTVQNTYGLDGKAGTADDVRITIEGVSYKGGLGDWKVTNDAVTHATLVSLMNPRPTAVAVPALPAVVDACNPAGVATNVEWAAPLPPATSTVTWTQDPTSRARTATLVDPVGTRWSDDRTTPITFALPADSGLTCQSRGIGANTGR